MARQQRKSARGKKPITSHPLFPAVVALWFGALFGLGSLAIRPSLIEAMVLASRLPEVLPAAAPPLGVTARILMALMMGGLGGILGAIIAYRMARTKPEPRERKRKATVADEPVKLRARDVHPDAPARRPISASEELGEDDDEPFTHVPPTSFGQKDRIAQHSFSDSGVNDSRFGDSSFRDFGMADRQPGREQPEFAQPSFDEPPAFDQAEAEAPAITGRRRPLMIAETSDALPVYHDDLAPLPGGAPQIVDVPRFSMPMDLTPANNDVADDADDDMLDLGAFADPAPAMQDFAQPHAFAAPYVPPITQTPIDASLARGIFGAPLPGVAVAEVAAAEAAPPFSATPPYAAPAEEPLEEPLVVEDEMPAEETRADDALIITPPAPLLTPTTARLDLPTGSAAERIESAPLGALSHVELIERLALTLQRRRMPPEGSPIAGTTPATTQEAAPEMVEAADFAPTFTPSPAPAPVFTDTPATSGQFARFATEAPADNNADVSADIAPSPPPVPAALRPISFDDHDHDGDDFLASLRLPRGLSPDVPAEAIFGTTADFSAPEAPQPATPVATFAQPAPASPVRQMFVRVEEPVGEDAPIEPVVIFPGQSMVRDAAANEAAAMRRFDAPGNPGQPPAGANINTATPIRDPAETERALRAALSTLQRMSGAA